MGFIQLYRFRSKRVSSLIFDSMFLSTCSCDEDATSSPLSTPASGVPTVPPSYGGLLLGERAELIY
jgi:hypothetical protein